VNGSPVAPPENARVRYDLRVRTVLGPAARACLAPGGECSALGRGTVFRFRLVRECDLTELHSLLIDKDIDVISIRMAG
jgi:hypothetical protein